MRRTTELNAVLADWDEQFLPNGREKFFSVGFVNKKGEFIFVSRARRSGLRKQNMKANDLKGLMPVDADGNQSGHIYPVWIHSILYFRSNIYFNLFDQ
jgi:hypothetical protein